MTKKQQNGLSYKTSGVDIDAANATKKKMRENMKTTDPRVLNAVGAFASLFEASFPGYKHPVLVQKTEEPGSKQLLSIKHGRVRAICEDMLHHLFNDIAVMGAVPLTVQDAIICGKMEADVVSEMVKSMADICRIHGCTLTGGETSEQPGTLAAGTYVLTSSVVGIVDKPKIIDGSRIRKGDTVIAVASNGLHTNGYSLVRKLMEKRPDILDDKVNGETFLDAVLRPHTSYLKGLRGLFDLPELHGMAHITGGGIAENLDRVLPADLDARIDLSTLPVLPIFNVIRDAGDVSDADMLRTFNMGAGLVIVADATGADVIRNHLATEGYETAVIGEIVPGAKAVGFTGNLRR
ncbi:MAG: phosphoribosylformylglycinamidine cyclo-ligase [Candidatus Peribacteraceae bacterium]|nr:phosphoribosylformylglycinamidine cyclo-ligase [Candidatus Peribacteraceae bacterium]